MKFNFQQAKKVLSFTTKILQKIPKKGDAKIDIALKSLSILDSLYDTMNPTKHRIQNAVDVEGYTLRNDKALVNLLQKDFFANQFEISRIELSMNETLVRHYSKRFGILYFNEHGYGTYLEMRSAFWSSPGFKFKEMFQLLWGHHHNRIDVRTVQMSQYDSLEFEFTETVLTDDPWVGSAQDRLEKFCRGHERFVVEGISRTYLFVGKPGTGKSTFAIRAAERLGARVMRMDADSFVRHTRELIFLIENIQPEFLVVDDLDRATNLSDNLSKLLNTFSDFKIKNPGVGVIFTVNDESKLDLALKRPGRIDSIMDFEDLELGDRREILRAFLPVDFGQEAEVEKLLEMTREFSPAYLKEIAIQLRYSGVEEVMKTVERMLKTVTMKSEEVAK